MLNKYVEQRFPRYFKFGGSSDGSKVNVSSEKLDGVLLSPEDAEILIADQNATIDCLCKMADAFDKASPEHFNHFWYGSTAPKEDYETLKRDRDRHLADVNRITEGLNAAGYSAEQAVLNFNLWMQQLQRVRAALEYTNVLLERLPPSQEIEYRINANKGVLKNETES